METSSMKPICVICNKEMRTYLCDGCSQRFCRKHLDEHHKDLEKQFDLIEMHHDQLKEMINQKKNQDQQKHLIINDIDQWEIDSINKIKQTANQCREKLIKYIDYFLLDLEKKLHDLAQQIIQMRREHEFNDLDLNQMKHKLNEVEKELLQPMDLSIEQKSTSFINKISLHTPFNIRWKQFATTIAGGNNKGNNLNQFYNLSAIRIDDRDTAIYIADSSNCRIIEWKLNAQMGQIVAGGNGQGDQINQLNHPTDVIIDQQNNSLIIADYRNRRLVRWSRQVNPNGQIIMSNIDCYGLAMHKDGTLYISDSVNNEVRRWKKGETTAPVVAGGNGEGDALNQFHCPTSLFVDNHHTLYISDRYNHRVMKWMKNANEGVVVAGGNGDGDDLTQLSFPYGVIVDQFNQVYVSDWGNDRVMRWCEGENEGTIMVGGNEAGNEANQFSCPIGLCYDSKTNLYVADNGNTRIQRFDIDKKIDPLNK